MLPDSKIKRTALMVAVDICLRKGKNSPKRCARNLVELGMTAYPDKLSTKEQTDLYQSLIIAITELNTPDVHNLFSHSFFCQSTIS